MKITIFPNRSDEGRNFAESVLTDLRHLVCSMSVDCITCEPPESKWSVLNACLTSDLVLFDATYETDPLHHNYRFAVGQLRYLYHVILFSRNKLPANFQGPHNLLGASITYGTLSSMGPKSHARLESLRSWISARAEAILGWRTTAPPMQAQSVDDEIDIVPLIATNCAALHAMNLSPGSPGNLHEELGRFLTSYYGIVASISGLLYLNNQNEVREVRATHYGRLFERIVLEHRLRTRYPAFRDGSNILERFFNQVHQYALHASHKWQDLLIRLLLTQSLVNSLNACQSIFDRLKLWRLFQKLQRDVVSMIEAQTIAYQEPIGAKGVSSNVACLAVAHRVTLAGLLGVVNQCKPGDTLDQWLADTNNEHESTVQAQPSAIAHLITVGIRSNRRYTDDMRKRYKGFISYRTHEYSKITNGNDYYLVDPATFSESNEVFSLRMRFHLMRLLYEVIIQFDRFYVYPSEDYLSSWWTCFELLAFVNAKPGNEKKVKAWEGSLSFDPCQFIVSEQQLFVLQRHLLYSNPMILEEEQIPNVVPAIRKIFGSGFDLAQSEKWDAIVVQCRYSKGFVNLDSLLTLERPYHIFIPMNSFRIDELVLCPSYKTSLCPLHDNEAPCRFRFVLGNSNARRLVWRDTELAASSIQEVDAVYLAED
jgi:hypothetical protein